MSMRVHVSPQSCMLACVCELLLEMACPQHPSQGKSTVTQRKVSSDHPNFQSKQTYLNLQQKKCGWDYGASQLGGTIHSIPLHIRSSLESTEANSTGCRGSNPGTATS